MVLDPVVTKKDGDTTTPGQETLPGDLSQTSAAEQATSKIDEEKQYGGAEVKAEIKTAVEDALSADGRVQKDRADKAEAENKRLTGDVQTLTTNVNTLTGQMADVARAQNDADAEKVKDDPVALGSLRARQANAAEAIRLRGVQTEQEATKAKQDAREAAIAQSETSVAIKLAAMAAGVDETKLKDLVPDGDPTRLANAATLLKGTVPAVEIDPTTGKPKALTTKPASAISAGDDARSVSQKMLDNAKAK